MSKPVIYIPGYPGSHILERQTGKKIFVNFQRALFQRQQMIEDLQGPDDLSRPDHAKAGEPIRKGAKIVVFDLAKQADTLYRILDNLGIDAARFGWDWRRPVWDPPLLDRLRATIEQAHRDGGSRPVALVVHSTGGLVLRALLERDRQDAAFLRRIERVIAFGVPWAGAIKSLIFLAGQRGFALLIDKRGAQRILSHSWAAFDLLPPDPAKTVMEDAAGNPLKLTVDGAGREISPLIRRGWFPAELRQAMELRADHADEKLGSRTPTIELAHPIPITNVVGWGWPTAVQATIAGTAHKVAEIVEISGDDDLDGGDGTVPRRSAAWLRGPEVTTFHLPLGAVPGAKKHPHQALWRNPGGRNLLRHHLGGKALEPFLYGAVDPGDFGPGPASVRLRLVALDGDGRRLGNARVRTVDLSGGQQLEQDFEEAFDGRHLITIPRSRIPRVGTQLRRFTVDIRGEDGGVEVARRRTFFIRR